MNNILLTVDPTQFVPQTIVQWAQESSGSHESIWTALIIPFVIIMVLVLLNGLFVAAEFAMIGVRPSRLQQMSEEGNTQAADVLAIRIDAHKQDSYIATAQVGITIVTIILGMYGEPRIAHYLEENWLSFLPPEIIHTVAFVLVLSLLTYLHVVIGEMIPKSMALGSAEQVVIWINRPMRAIQTLVNPAVRFLNAIGRIMLRAMRIPSAEGHSRAHTPEEIEQIVAESAEGGLLKEEEEEIIRNIFDFGDRVAGQVMTPRPRVQAISHLIERDALIKLVSESRHSRFPVYEEDRDHIIGILHLKDLVKQVTENPTELDVEKLLRPAPAVPVDQPLTKLLAAFKRLRIHMAVVLDEFGGMAGIVTLEDLVEEIVGEVRDEFDREREPYVKVRPGLIEAEGSYLVADLAEELYLGEDGTLPNVDTVGGLVVASLGRPPKVGDECDFGFGIRFHVLDVNGRAVTRCRIEYPPPPTVGSAEQE